MKILSCALLLLASMAFALGGCSNDSASLVSPNEQALTSPGEPVALEKGGAVVHSATGGAHVSDFWGGEVKWTFSFTAKQYDGRQFSGQVQFVDHAGLKFHGTIIDLNVVGNEAKMCWTYTSGPWTGLFGCAVVADNGEGKKATGPDMVSSFLWTDGSDIGTATIAEITAMTPDEFTSWVEDYLFPVLIGIPIPGPVLVPISQGNIQVR